jgi:alpha-mannosidase
LTVHLVTHTHDDVGWKKTFDEYFSGANIIDYERGKGVNDILDTLIAELERDPRRKFTYVEMKYFTMWYNYLHQKDKDRVKKLIKNGQLEITQGGWTASDEACPNYQDLILNMHLGHKFLQDEFGVKPRIGWMLDSFGHS